MRVHSIFKSISGEVGLFPQGSWCTIIRLAECNLRCVYCDAEGAQRSWGEQESSTEAIVKEVGNHCLSRVLITGGEPLLQLSDLKTLCYEIGLEHCSAIQIETNGSILPDPYKWPNVNCWVVDYKLNGSGQNERMLPPESYWKWIKDGSAKYMKFVCCTLADFEQAKEVMEVVAEEGAWTFAFSACPPLSHDTLFQAIKETRLTDCLFNVQIHKVTALSE